MIGGHQATAVLFLWYSRVWLCPTLLRAIEIAIKFKEQLVGAGAVLKHSYSLSGCVVQCLFELKNTNFMPFFGSCRESVRTAK